MKSKLLNISLAMAVVILTAATSCDKVPINGDLDGMWQLMSIETPDGVRETKADQVYLSFQLHLTQWSRIDERNIYAHFTHSGDSIRFFDFVHISDQATEGDNDEWITPAEMAAGTMDPWGIHTTDITYHVQRLDGSHLVLERADTLITYRKF